MQRGLLVAAVVVGLSPALWADPAKPATRSGTGRAWKAKRTEAPRPLPPPTITLAVFNTGPDVEKSRVLKNQGMSAYQAGRYDAAVKKFAAAIDNTPAPTPELIYYAAQAYRLKGERAKAIELYEKYLDVAPRGPAANTCRAELEKLRDIPQ